MEAILIILAWWIMQLALFLTAHLAELGHAEMNRRLRVRRRRRRRLNR